MSATGGFIADATRANVLTRIHRLRRRSARGVVGAVALVLGSLIAPSPASAAAAPRISITDLVAGESAGVVSVTVSLSAPSTASASVRVVAAGGTTASSITDYRMLNGSITFAPGERRKSVRVQILDDRTTEPLERLFLSLSSPVNATIARPDGAVAIIDDDRIARTPRLFARDVIVDEKARTARVPVLLGGPAGQSSNRVVTVRYTTVSSTAASGGDYTATRGTLRFAPGDNVKHVLVTIRDDTSGEAAERFALRLSAPTNAVLGDASSTVTIGASDQPRVAQPSISVTDSIVGEGAGWLDVPVTLNAPSTSVASVRVVAAGGTTASSISDYGLLNSTLTFAPGETTTTIRVFILDDLTTEPLERLFISLTSPVNATIARPDGAVAIVDNDRIARSPRLVARSVIVDEKARTAFVPVLLGGSAGQASNRAVTVRYTTVNGTATSGADYIATRGTLRFAPGDNVKHVPVTIRDDTSGEAAERFALRLSAPTNAVLGTASGTVTIGASDQPRVAQPSISVADRVVGEGAGWVDVPVTLSAPSTSVASVRVVAAGGTTASSISDYGLLNSTLTFAPGETTTTIRVFILDDLTTEPLETLIIDLTSPVNATIGNAPGTLTIRDDD